MSAQQQTQKGEIEPGKPEPKGSRLKMAIAATLVVFLIATAVWYFGFNQRQPDEKPTSKPTVSFGYIGYGGPSGNRTMFTYVTAVSARLAFSSLKLSLAMNGSPAGPTQPLVADAVIPFGSTARIIVHDLDGNANLTANDTILVYGMPAEHSWNLTLLWSDYSFIKSLTWSTWAVGSITFSIQSTPSLWIMQVTDASMMLSLSWVKLTIKDRGGTTVPSVDSIPLKNLTAGEFGTHGALYYGVGVGSDIGVTEGSSINVSKAFYPSGFAYEVTDGYATLASGVFQYWGSVVFSISISGGNYTMAVASAPVGLPINGTFLTIANGTGIIGSMDSVPLTNLTAANWATYEAEYRKVGAEDYLVAGASLTVSRTAYPAGCNYTISDGWEILASGQFTKPHIDLSVTTSGRNFTMTVTDATPGLSLGQVTLTIKDQSNNVKLNNVALSDLTSANWGANKVEYRKVGAEANVAVGASMLVYKPIYSFCYKYTLMNGTEILADGTLFDCSLSVGMMISQIGSNWTLTIAALPSGLTNVPLMNITLSILDVFYDVVVPMDAVSFTSLTAANWSLYKVIYQSMIPSDYLTVGSRLMVYNMVYLPGVHWEMLSGNRCLSYGQLM